MPRVHKLSHYPVEYGKMIRGCALGGKTTAVRFTENSVNQDGTLKTPREQAISLRYHYYGYLGSLKAEAGRLRKQDPQLLSDGERDTIELDHLREMVLVTVTEPATVTWQSRENSWQAKALAGAVTTGGSDAATEPAGLDEIAARLLAVQSKEGGK